MTTNTKINWHNIRTINTSSNEGFEEFVCQLARKEIVPNKNRFIRKGKPDAGVECFWILKNNDEWAWQAKYFTASLDDNQWGQIDKSVKTVINKHKKVKKYFIAIPIDPADARIEGRTSSLEKWDKHVKKWEKWAKNEHLLIEFIPWWSSNLIERLQRPENAGLTYFWFNKEEFTDEWFRQYVDMATLNLGERYTPEVNFELDIVKIFDGIARDEKFKELFKNQLNELLLKLNSHKLRIKDKIIFENKQELRKNIIFLIKQYNYKIPFEDINTIDYDTILKITDNIEITISKLETRVEELRKQEDTGKNDKQIYNSAIHYLKDCYHYLNSFKDFINGDINKLANKRILLLNGEAGIGKSHLLADIANKRINEDKNTILLLGQHFTSNEDPWTQIFKQLKLSCRLEEFLGALESKAQIQGSRIIIFIDAINEGNGRLFWPDHISGFIRSFKNYKWLGLVLSIRTSYVELIAPLDDLKLNDIIVRHTHQGFINVEYKASKLFFKNYKIEQPSIPLLHPEFQNPLFLKLFCDSLNKSGLTKIPDGMQGITKITNFFIKAINNRLSSPKAFNYPESINVVDESIKNIVEFKLENDLNYVPFEDAYSLIDVLQKKYNIYGNFIESLISEGIISKDIYRNKKGEHEEYIYIAYERFEDHITISYLLNNLDENSLSKEFEDGGCLNKFIKDSRSLNYYNGIIEALSIQLPEKFGKELYELIPEFNDLEEWDKNHISGVIATAFVSSLLWRKHSTITEEVYDYIDDVVLRFNGTSRYFWDTVISIAPLPDHILNANKTHDVLYSNSMPDRDSWWTQIIHYGCSDDTPIKRLIDWAWSSEDKTHISDESIKLSSIMMAWFLTSTNRRLRDSTTKALISILKDRIKILIEVLNNFKEVNDPYVYERLFAVAYGCALRTKNIESLVELSKYIYTTIFDQDTIYPHVLLRDYARNVIEYTIYLGIDFDGDIKKVRPPYKSSFPSIPNDKEIENYKLSYNHEDFKDYNISQNSILYSMEVEHTRNGKVAFYGDFGRYVFQSNFSNWKQLDPLDLKNIAIKRVFDLGYDVKKHGEFDKRIHERNGNRHYLATERIGKKYQWIAMHELLAQVADNYQMEGNENEVEMFQGSWDPFIRDIDPSVIKYQNDDSKPNFELFDSFYDNWGIENKYWLEKRDDYPDPLNFINIPLDNEDWLILEGNLDWEEPDLLGNEKYSYPQKSLWYQIKSYLVQKDETENIIQWLNGKDFMGSWLPESYGRYEIFNREFYWSPAYNYLLKNELNGTYIQSIIDRTSNKNIGEVIVTTERNDWATDYDKSNEESSGLKICNEIFNNMNLIYGDEEGILYSQENEKICYDLSEIYSTTGHNLIIKKNSFLKFLDKNNYSIIWIIRGEKIVYGGNNQEDFDSWPRVSGVYYFDKNSKLYGILNKFIITTKRFKCKVNIENCKKSYKIKITSRKYPLIKNIQDDK